MVRLHGRKLKLVQPLGCWLLSFSNQCHDAQNDVAWQNEFSVFMSFAALMELLRYGEARFTDGG